MAPDTAPPPFTDLHNHLVPGVDDGSDSVTESLEALALLYREGVRHLVSTPHLLLPRLGSDGAIGRELEFHRRAFDRLAAACASREDLPTIGLGQEIWAPDATSLRRIVHRGDVGLGGTRAVLVEFGFDLQGTHLDVVRAALDADRMIVIAHPERYRYLPGTEPLELMRRWRDLGALLQVNVGSFSGYYGGQKGAPYALAWEMAAEGLVDLVATDHHGIRRAGVSPLEAYRELVARGESALAARSMSSSPAELLRQPPPVVAPAPVSSREAAG
ncbi:MAG TPA: CpsB/CapC family capsule biosynthesis tyrosine phosphatase [Gemmatimonadales bacterium]|jgi:protein-tyrosine phosphatase